MMIVEAIRVSVRSMGKRRLHSTCCSQRIVGQPHAAGIIDTPLTSTDGRLAPHNGD